MTHPSWFPHISKQRIRLSRDTRSEARSGSHDARIKTRTPQPTPSLSGRGSSSHTDVYDRRSSKNSTLFLTLFLTLINSILSKRLISSHCLKTYFCSHGR